MNRNRNAQRGRRSSGRFGPYNEYEIYSARETLSVLAFNSRNPRITSFLNKAYESNIKFSGTDRVPFHFSQKLFPSPDEWPPVANKASTEADSSTPGPSHENTDQVQGVKVGAVGRRMNSEGNAGLFVIDRQGSVSGAEDRENKEKEEPSESDDDLIVIDETSDGEIIHVDSEEDDSSLSYSAKKLTTSRAESPTNSSVKALKQQVSSNGSRIKENDQGEADVIDGSMTEGDGRSNSGIVERLKCDLCSFHVKSDEEMKMKLHLTNEKHYGASVMEGYLYGNDFKPLFVIQEMKLKVKVDISTLVPICPISLCSDIYPNIWSCAVHFDYKHGIQKTNTSGAYGVGKVLDSRMLVINLDPICENCGASFNSQKALNRHWRALMLHYPFTLPPPGQVAFFRCLYCETIFNDFIVARSHCLTSHSDRASQSKGIRIVYVEKPQEKIPIPKRKLQTQNSDWFDGANRHAELLSLARKQPQNRFERVKKKKKKKKKSSNYSQAANFQQY